MNTIVAVPFDSALAEHIGKRGSENSITFYNRKIGNDTVVALMPTSIEEKFYALPESLLLAGQVVVSTASVDKLLGEVLVACSLLHKRVLLTDDNDISSLLEGLSLEATVVSRDSILDALLAYQPDNSPTSAARIDIDKAFNVKGVGTVALGIVTSGTVRVHDTLYHGSGKMVAVRSIQSQDEDIPAAEKGTRVGLALKGIDENELEKGDILSSTQTIQTKRLGLRIRTSSIANESIAVGKTYSIAAGFAYSNATVEEANSNTITLRLEKGISVAENDTVLITREAAPRIFAIGTAEKISDTAPL
ncbi:MAG: EF-Tu/IF-2/RF-3 family GTPase [Candidatus Marsarchaeota archaeon]|jgi:selenocysteine-specific translation elongation factor|nr:EF-Tu/IF-2/RF-3 family GTPase [Candidatus Marsarchaeota archaeon]